MPSRPSVPPSEPGSRTPSVLAAVAVAFLRRLNGEYAPEELDRLVGPILDGTAD
jgi:hypothetical protein